MPYVSSRDPWWWYWCWPSKLWPRSNGDAPVSLSFFVLLPTGSTWGQFSGGKVNSEGESVSEPERMECAVRAGVSGERSENGEAEPLPRDGVVESREGNGRMGGSRGRLLLGCTLELNGRVDFQEAHRAYLLFSGPSKSILSSFNSTALLKLPLSAPGALPAVLFFPTGSQTHSTPVLEHLSQGEPSV